MRQTYSRYGGIASAYLTQERGAVWLDRIEVRARFRGRGWAGELLRDICMAADSEGETLHLEVSPDATGLSAGALAEWYERHGFICDPDEDRVMVRRPHAP